MATDKAEKGSRPGKINLADVRCSFLYLFEPKPGMIDEDTGIKGADKYQGTFLIDKNTPQGKKQIAAIKKVIEEVKKAQWGEKIPNLKPDKICLRDGDLEDYDGYEGMMYISSSNGDQPVIVDRDRTELTRENGGPAKLYSGAYANASLRIWAQDNKHGKRINCSLEGVQYLRKGDAFGAKPIDPNEEFPDLSEDDEDLNSIVDEEENDLV